MTTQPIICLVTAAAKANANLVWAAWGKGPDTFSRRLAAKSGINENSTPTHYLMADSSIFVEDVAIIQQFANNQLPPLPDGMAWGVDGVISAADALAAINGANLQCYSASGNVEPLDHANAILDSRGLAFIPDAV